MTEWMQTFTGRQFFLLDPKPEDISILDVAHSLSMQCRFCGHTSMFYSVAEHSIHMSYLVSDENALVALLHDAPETWIHDLSRPLKRTLGSRYEEIEDRIWSAVAQRFNLPLHLPDQVKEMDNRLLGDELRQLFNQVDLPHTDKGDSTFVRIAGMDPVKAEREFLNRFSELVTKDYF